MLFGNKQQIEELTLKNQELTRQLNDSNARYQDLESQFESLNHQLEEKELQINLNKDLIDMFLGSVENIEQIRESVAELAMSIMEKDSAMTNLNEVFSSSSEVLASISSTVDDIGVRANESSEKMGSLRAVSDSIANFVSVITNISDQTNLLALNAAIEAAPAGDQGRGFAVVADEVRSLAQNTGNATSEIGSLIDTIDSDSATAATQIEQLCDYTASISEQNHTLGNSYQHILDSSKEMRDVINQSAMRAFIQTVKLDHIVWKKGVFSVILERSDLSVDDFPNHHNCRLGQWYYQGEGKKLANQSAYAAIEDPHKQVHDCGVEAIRSFQAGDSNQIREQLKRMESASNELFRYLSTLEAQEQ